MQGRDMERRDELMDRGWERMSKILDAEMPQERRRRRFFWLPILGVLLIGTLLAVTATQSGTATDGEPEPSNSEPIEESAAMAANALESVAPEQQVPESVSAKQVGGPTDTPATAPAESNNTVRPEAVQEAVAATVSTSDQNSKLPLESQSPERRDAIDPLPNLNTPEGSTLTSATTDELRARVEVPVMHLSALSLNVDKSGIDADLPIVPAASKFKPVFGMDAFGAAHIMAGPLAIRGGEGGLLARVKVGPRVDIGAGLSYSHYRHDGLIDISRSRNDQAEFLTVLDPPDTTNVVVVPTVDFTSAGYDTIEQVVRNLNYINMPLFVDYRVLPNLSLRGGFRVSYLVNAPIEEGIRYTVPNTVTGPGQTFDAETTRNTLTHEKALRRWDFAPMVGLAVQLGRWLSLDVQYQVGLVPYINRPGHNRNDFNRTMSIGLSARLF